MNEYQTLCSDGNFDKDEYDTILKKNKGMAKLAVTEYRHKLFQKRNNINLDFSETKENIENLFIEKFDDKQYVKLLGRLKSNGWTIEQAYAKAKETGRTLFYLSTTKNI